MDSSRPSKPNTEETRVDLGDDLLESTRTSVSDTQQSLTVPVRNVHPEQASNEELESARILMSEGLWDEAKEALHRSLRHHSENRLARKLLEEVHARELQELLDRPHRAEPSGIVEEDVAGVLKKLEEDWHLGLDVGESSRLSLVASQEAHQELARCVSEQALTMSAREKADLAIGFLQMELPEIALSLLQSGSLHGGVTSALYCWALLQAGKAFECVSLLDVKLRDQNLSPEVRVEMEYLLARARENLGERRLALELYGALGEYRDSSSRKIRLQSQGEGL
ncbi:hypothetical protein EBZ37_08635 [bacterium]|nr:hypothetical protein [bacterium]